MLHDRTIYVDRPPRSFNLVGREDPARRICSRQYVFVNLSSVPPPLISAITAPLRPWIKYQAQHFEHKHWAKDYPLVGYPSDELDARWTKLQKSIVYDCSLFHSSSRTNGLSAFYTEVPAEYMQRMGRLNEGIQLENGNYAATYSVMHLLHCVVRFPPPS
jgi:hypothetical protein